MAGQAKISLQGLLPIDSWCWIGKNGSLASLGSTWHLTHHFLMQWSLGLMCRLAKWPLSSAAENSCRRCVLVPGNSDHLEPLVCYHRSWLSSAEPLQGFLLIHGSSFIHLILFIQPGVLLIQKWNSMGSLICVTAIFLMRSLNANFFLRGREKNLASIWWEV